MRIKYIDQGVGSDTGIIPGPHIRKAWCSHTGLILLITALNILFYYLRQNQAQGAEEDGHGERSHSSVLPPNQLCQRFSLNEIKLATNNFDEALFLGKGGFATVYEGIIKNGSIKVAIKRLDGSKQGVPEFWAEIKMLSNFRHSHLVSLLGYCNEDTEMILVYEYMPSGTLKDHLHKFHRSNGSSKHPPLSWVQRLKICIGAARGLDYLHTGTSIQQRVIHRDVKTSNILLDVNLQAKIADFGLSIEGPANQTGSTKVYADKIIGTFGYMDPEYFLTRRLTRKSDVYAFGVVLFEALCGRPAVDENLESEQIGLAGWAQQCVREGTLDHIIDHNLREQILPDCLSMFVQIADQCLLRCPKGRPTMAEVVVRLESALALQEQRHSSINEEEMVNLSQGSQNEWSLDSIIEEDMVNLLRGSENEWSLDSIIEEKMVNLSLGSEYEWSFNSIEKSEDHIVGRYTEEIDESMIELGDSAGTQPQMNSARKKSFLRKLRSLFSTKSPSKPAPMIVEAGETEVESCNEDSEKVVQFDGDFMLTADSLLRLTAETMGETRYKVFLEDGNLLVVKKLCGIVEQFEAQIASLGKIHHPNVLALSAYYLGPRHTACISRYMPNGNLESFLHARGLETAIYWPTRMNMLIGITRGLSYLHSKQNIVHGNLSSRNILLDEDDCPVIADIGYTRLVVRASNTQRHYRAPELHNLKKANTMTDVYSLGVIILELLTGKSPRHLPYDLPQWVASRVAEGMVMDVFDQELMRDALNNGDHMLQNTLFMALRCVHTSAEARPEAQLVLQKLEEMQLELARYTQSNQQPADRLYILPGLLQPADSWHKKTGHQVRSRRVKRKQRSNAKEFFEHS